MTTIAVQLLTQARTCEMGSLSFSAMSPLNFLSSTTASFLIMPSNERKKEEKYIKGFITYTEGFFSLIILQEHQHEYNRANIHRYINVPNLC